MLKRKLQCRTCDKPFTEKPPGSPGFYNQCAPCAANEPEPELIGGNMIWEHKTAPTLELKPLSQAKAFARRTRRTGASVANFLVEPREPRPSPADFTAQEFEAVGDKRDRGRHCKDK